MGGRADCGEGRDRRYGQFARGDAALADAWPYGRLGLQPPDGQPRFAERYSGIAARRYGPCGIYANGPKFAAYSNEVNGVWKVTGARNGPGQGKKGRRCF